MWPVNITDWYDERLTSQLRNQSRHGLLKGLLFRALLQIKGWEQLPLQDLTSSFFCIILKKIDTLESFIVLFHQKS